VARGREHNYGVAPNTDLLARVAYQRFDLQNAPTLNGYSAEVGVRTAFTPMIEGYALAGYEDYSKKAGYNPDGEFYGRVGAAAKFTQLGRERRSEAGQGRRQGVVRRPALHLVSHRDIVPGACSLPAPPEPGPPRPGSFFCAGAADGRTGPAKRGGMRFASGLRAPARWQQKSPASPAFVHLRRFLT
jgi:hypothetical protein